MALKRQVDLTVDRLERLTRDIIEFAGILDSESELAEQGELTAEGEEQEAHLQRKALMSRALHEANDLVMAVVDLPDDAPLFKDDATADQWERFLDAVEIVAASLDRNATALRIEVEANRLLADAVARILNLSAAKLERYRQDGTLIAEGGAQPPPLAEL